ncbi:MAG: MarR family winged helix-turn-helix transcriptional regulator [Saprospiraceae bacterium]
MKIKFYLGFLTNRIGRFIANQLKSQLGKEEFDMPSHCIGILADLWEQDGVIQQDLAISVVKDKATIARTLELMEKKNIIVRIKDEKDKSNKKIFLTYKGHQLQNQVLFHGNTVTKEAKKGISKEELDHCIKTLEKIYGNLKNKL